MNEEVDWYIGYTYFRQYGALAHLSKEYGNDLFFFGVSTLDTDMTPHLLERVLEEEENLLDDL